MKRSSHILVLLVSIWLHYSCDDLLNLSSTSKIPDSEYWTSPDEFKLAANAFYPYLLTFPEIIQRDLQADIAVSFSISTVSSSSYPVPQTDANYTRRYEHLRAINILLNKAQSYAAPSEIRKYVAEAKFFRAWEHWLLLRDYGPIVVADRVFVAGDSALYRSRPSRDSVVSFIIHDLEQAIPALPKPGDQGIDEIGRITRGAAQAFLSRVCLYEGSWCKYHFNQPEKSNHYFGMARQYAKLVMDSPDYALFYDDQLGVESYRYLFILEKEKDKSNPAGVNKSANKEYILANRYDQSARIINYNISRTMFSAFFSPTKKMIDMFLCSDGLPIENSPLFKGYGSFGSVYQNRDARMTLDMCVPGQKYWNNGVNGRVNWSGNEEDYSTAIVYSPSLGMVTKTGYNTYKFCTERNVPDREEAYDCPVIRLAEVYLIFAEATYELNGEITDAALNASINLIRDRVKMTHLTNTLVNENGLNMLNEIRRERAVELFAEGFRLDDLRRWKTAEVEMSQSLLGVKVTGTDYEAEHLLQVVPEIKYIVPTSWEGRLTPDGFYLIQDGSYRKFLQRHYLLPIPSFEIKLNPNLSQNTDW